MYVCNIVQKEFIINSFPRELWKIKTRLKNWTHFTLQVKYHSEIRACFLDDVKLALFLRSCLLPEVCSLLQKSSLKICVLLFWKKPSLFFPLNSFYLQIPQRSRTLWPPRPLCSGGWGYGRSLASLQCLVWQLVSMSHGITLFSLSPVLLEIDSCNEKPGLGSAVFIHSMIIKQGVCRSNRTDIMSGNMSLWRRSPQNSRIWVIQKIRCGF